MRSGLFGGQRLRAIVRHTPDTKGQSLVELALVLPVLLLLVLAAVDLGRIFFARIAVANAAREGAYEASYRGSFVANTGCSDTNTVMCAILNESQSSLTITPADVEWSCNNPGGCAPGAYGDRVSIKVTGHFQLLTPILSVFFGGTDVAFSSTAVADVVSTASGGASPTAAPTATPTDTPAPTDSESPDPTESPAPTTPTCNFPGANFGWTQQNKNRPVVFTSVSSPTTGSCAITFYRWEYGLPDGSTDAGNLPTVSHSFANQGFTYNVTLTVTNPRGTTSITLPVTTKG